MTAPRSTVAVIGLGALGLVSVKNLLEEDFDVTGFEKNPYVGGLWKVTDATQTSALETTLVNISKERGCFTDFPFPDSIPSHPSAPQVQEYLESYVEHFNLGNHLHLSTTVNKVTRDKDKQKWVLNYTTPEQSVVENAFDKLVVANGNNNLPNLPTLAGQDKFKGEILHSIDFKRPTKFEGKRVIVVGIGNSAADTSTALCGIASKVYLSHKHGALVLPRQMPSGDILDQSVTYRKSMIQYTMTRWAPEFAENFGTRYIKKLQDTAFVIKPEWKLECPSALHTLPILSDDLIDELHSGRIESVAGLKEIKGDYEVELDDGTIVEADAIIWCTGYLWNYSLLGEYDPTLKTQEGYIPTVSGKDGRHQVALPRLYQNVFSLDHPESLAFAGIAAFHTPIFVSFDLASMAIAQYWKKPELMPSRKEMLASYQKHMSWANGIIAKGPLNPRFVNAPEWTAWVEEAAGVRVAEHLGYGLSGWKFWYQDKGFCNVLMDGIFSPHVFRLFESDRRKPWTGARAEIEKVNNQLRERLEKAKKQQAA